MNMLKIKLLFLVELLTSSTNELIFKGGNVSIGQRAMAGGAFKMLTASIQKMSERDLQRVTAIIELIRTDLVIDGLAQEALTPVEYADLIGHFLEHAKRTDSDTTK